MTNAGGNPLFAPWRMEWVTRDGNQPDDECVFCTMEADSADCENRVIARSDHGYAVLNRSPYNPGHVLVVPTRHVSAYPELDRLELTDFHQLQQHTIHVVSEIYNPDGFNVGMNLGSAGGASIDDHLHAHIVPRWESDTTFMSVITDTEVIEESLDTAYDRLHSGFEELDRSKTTDKQTAVRIGQQ